MEMLKNQPVLAMSTKKTCDNLLIRLYDEARRYQRDPDTVRLIARHIELINVLKGLGLFCFDGLGDLTPAVLYRGHKYVFDMIEPYQLAFYVDIATFDEENDDVKESLHYCFNDVCWTEFMMSIYHVEGYVVLSSSQYVGERRILMDEVLFMLKSMDSVLRRFHKIIKQSCHLKENVKCI